MVVGRWLVFAVMVGGCAASPQGAAVVVVPVGLATELSTTPTMAPGAGCSGAGTIHVAIAPLTNETGRPLAEIEAAVLPVLRDEIAKGEGLVLLVGGARVAGRCEVSLVPVVRPFTRDDGHLAVRLVLGVLWRSDGSLIGSVDKRLAKESVSPDDHASEDEVLTLAAKLAAESFVASAHAFTAPADD